MVIMAGNDMRADLDLFLAGHEAELIEFRRDLHANPELAYAEHRTTRTIISMSADRYLDQDQVLVRGTRREDIINHDVGDAATLGPIAALYGGAS